MAERSDLLRDDTVVEARGSDAASALSVQGVAVVAAVAVAVGLVVDAVSDWGGDGGGAEAADGDVGRDADGASIV